MNSEAVCGIETLLQVHTATVIAGSVAVLISAKLDTLARRWRTLACVMLLYLMVLTPGQVDPPRHKRDSRLGAAEDPVTSHNTAPVLPIRKRDIGPREP